MSNTTEQSSGAPAIRPFRVEFPEEELAELRRRVTATRLPTKELVADRSQGVQLATIQELARYWAADYDWRSLLALLCVIKCHHYRMRHVAFVARHIGPRLSNALAESVF